MRASGHRITFQPRRRVHSNPHNRVPHQSCLGSFSTSRGRRRRGRRTRRLLPGQPPSLRGALAAPQLSPAPQLAFHQRHDAHCQAAADESRLEQLPPLRGPPPPASHRPRPGRQSKVLSSSLDHTQAWHHECSTEYIASASRQHSIRASWKRPQRRAASKSLLSERACGHDAMGCI